MKLVLDTRLFIYGGLALFIMIASAGAYPQAGRVGFFYVGTVAFAILSMLYSKRIQINREAFISWMIFLVIFLVLLALRGEWFSNGMQNRVLVKLFIVFLVMLAWSALSPQEVIGIYIKVFNVLLMLSLPCLLLAYINYNIYTPIAFTGKYSSVNTTYYYTFDVTIRTLFGLHFIKAADVGTGIFRNQGIFWEPGVFSFFITWFYVLKNCYLKDKKLNGLYYLVEITTVSAAGIIIFLAAVFYVKVLHGKTVKRIRDFFLMLVMLVAIIMLLILNENGIEQFLRFWGGIFGRDFYNEASAISRWRDFYYGIMASMDKIWWGQGWDFSNYNAVLRIQANTGKAGEWGGITNSVVAVLYKYGIFFWMFYMWLLWRWSIRISEGSMWGLFLFLIFTATLMHEPLDSSIIILSFLLSPLPFAHAKKR